MSYNILPQKGNRPVILLVRPADAAAAWAADFADLGYDFVAAPVLTYVPVRAVPPAASEVEALVVTSARALAHLGPDWDGLRGKPVYIVGEQGAAQARAAGFNHIVEIAPDVAALVPVLQSVCMRTRFLYVRGDQVSRELSGVLSLPLAEVVTYRTEAHPALDPNIIEIIRAGQVRGVLFFSVASAQHFCTLVHQAGLGPACGQIQAWCLSRAVLGSVSSVLWANVQAASTPDRAGLRAVLASKG